jgi:hypothetical protein
MKPAEANRQNQAATTRRLQGRKEIAGKTHA